MARGTSLFQAVRSITAKVLSRQRVEELKMLQGDWRKEVWMQETTLTAQSQTIKKWSLVRSFPWMLIPAHKLIANVTTVIEMFGIKKALSLGSFTWKIASQVYFFLCLMST